MTKKTGLGRGLEALIATDITQAPGSSITEIPISQIAPNPRQPRSVYDHAELTSLASSISDHGLIQPLVVSRHETIENQYILIAGERRLIAAKEAGLSTVPALIREVTDQQRLVLALIENLQRSDLNPIEEAEAYRQLSEDFQLRHEDIAQQVGKSREDVTNTLRLLKLSPNVQEAVVSRIISKTHARAIAGLSNWQAQNAALRTVIEKRLSVRETEELVSELTGESHKKRLVKVRDPDIIEIEDRLRAHLGARVRLSVYQKGGNISIRYYSDEELNDLLSLLIPDEMGDNS